MPTALDEEVARRLEESFARGAGHGLLQLGAGEVGTALPAVFSYWREFAARYVTALCTHPGIQLEEEGPRNRLRLRPMRSWSGWPWLRR
jgi:hypothetical protein